jgi:hypothetical protein
LEERQVAEQRLAIVDHAARGNVGDSGVHVREQVSEAGVSSPHLMRPFPVSEATQLLPVFCVPPDDDGVSSTLLWVAGSGATRWQSTCHHHPGPARTRFGVTSTRERPCVDRSCSSS